MEFRQLKKLDGTFLAMATSAAAALGEGSVGQGGADDVDGARAGPLCGLPVAFAGWPFGSLQATGVP